MPDNQNNNNSNGQNGRRGVSGGFVFAIIIIIIVIGLIIWWIVSATSSAVTFYLDDFYAYLTTGNIYSLTVEPIYQTTVVVEGTYNDYGVSRSFTFTCDWMTYYETPVADLFGITVTDDGSVSGDGDYTLEQGTSYDESYNYTLNEIVRQQQLSGTLIVQDVNAYSSSWWDSWGATLIITILMIVIFVWLFSRLSRSMNSSNSQAMNFNRSRARKETSSKVRFSDVAGCDEEKFEMQEIVSYLKEPKKYVRYGAKLPKGILLVGPPGCGKTLLAKAVAGEAGVPFYSISGSDFVEMFVGVGAGRVRDMFRVAKQNAPCLVFIDEIDAVGRQRGAGLGGGNDEREQTLNQLLVEMDGFSDNSGIIVIAATNRDDVLDPALLRAGRFDRKITVNYPDRKGREEIFMVHSRNKHLAPDVNFEALSKRTVGFSGADIENIMNEAAILAARTNEEYITMEMIDEAIDRRIAGPAKSSRSLSEEERKIVAYHEAGHATIGIHLPFSDKVQKITIIPRGNTGGHVRMSPDEDRFLLTKREIEARIIGYLGGRASEEIFFDDISSGASNDIEVATRLARMMVTELGMSSLGPIQYEQDNSSVFLGRDYTNTQRNFSTETAKQIDEEVRRIIDESHEKAVSLLNEYKDDVVLIANVLLENETITAEEIEYLLEHRTMPPKKKKSDTPESDSTRMNFNPDAFVGTSAEASTPEAPKESEPEPSDNSKDSDDAVNFTIPGDDTPQDPGDSN